MSSPQFFYPKYFTHAHSPEQVLYRFSYGSSEFCISKRDASLLSNKPLLFVYQYENNPWAESLLIQFKSEMNVLHESGTAPLIDFLPVAGSRQNVQNMLNAHPFFAQSTEQSYIVSIGDWASTEVARFRAGYNKLHIPQIFCTQNNPQDLDLLSPNGTLLTNTSGIYGSDPTTFKRQVRSMQSVHGGISSVAIIRNKNRRYDLCPDATDETVARIRTECMTQNISTMELEITSDPHSLRLLDTYADRFQAVITLRDMSTYTIMSQLITLCNTHGLTLLASELASVHQGAALGFGNSPAEYVPHIIEMMVRAHLQDAPLHKMPVTYIQEKTMMRHNPHAFESQGISLTDQQKDLLDMYTIYAP